MGPKKIMNANLQRTLQQPSFRNQRWNFGQDMQNHSSFFLAWYPIEVAMRAANGTITNEELGRIIGKCRGHVHGLFGDREGLDFSIFLTCLSGGLLDANLAFEAIRVMKSWDTQRMIRFAGAFKRAAELCKFDPTEVGEMGVDLEIAAILMAAIEECPDEKALLAGDVDDLFADEDLVDRIIFQAKYFVPSRRLDISSEPFKGEVLKKTLAKWLFPGLLAYVACQSMWEPPRIDRLPLPAA